MARNRSTEVAPKKGRPSSGIAGKGSHSPPWVFDHQDLIHELDNAPMVNIETLSNTLNHIHFMDKSTLVHLYHPKYGESIFVKAYPEPCLGRELTCRWSDENLSGIELMDYQFLHLMIDDGKSMMLVPAILLEINSSCFTIELPHTSYVVGQRQAKRYVCKKIAVELIQSGFLAKGELLDFSTRAFRGKVKTESSFSFHWFNSDALVNIRLSHDQQILFSGPCRCIRHQGDPMDKEIVLAPADEGINRFKKRHIRNPRQHLVPSPVLIFDHPFFKKRVQLDVSDISTSGFSVYENKNERVLMPGMIITELIIGFSSASRMKCPAQVIYCLEENEKGVRCGLAILDMDINTYSHLSGILLNALDPHAHISSEVDMDTLWEFFFESDFIYPTKYGLIESHRKDFKETYRRLYQENPEIAQHFTCQINGRIQGHLSMLRVYEKAWMIQHHAALTTENRRAGLQVLKQIITYMNDMRRFPSAKFDYVICFFRPKSKFPDRVFGSFARYLKNPGGCSMDLFSYLSFTSMSVSTKLPEGWSLGECSSSDLRELDRFYSHYSRGLLLDSLGICQEGFGGESLEEVYARLGFLRKCRIYSLKHNGELTAVMIVEQSNLGINLSELLNAIKILVVSHEGPPWNILSIAISRLPVLYKNIRKIPVLIYPTEYVNEKGIPWERQYQMWILDVKHGDEYMEYMKRKLKMNYE